MEEKKQTYGNRRGVNNNRRGSDDGAITEIVFIDSGCETSVPEGAMVSIDSVDYDQAIAASSPEYVNQGL